MDSRGSSGSSTTTSLYRIAAPYFVAGFEVESGRVSRAAPIINYMLGWSPERVLSYCRGKKWLCDWVE